MMPTLCEPRAANTCTTAKPGKKLFLNVWSKELPHSTRPGCPHPHGWLYLVRNTIYLIWSSAMTPFDRADDHLGGLRDALAQMSFTLMAVLTEVAAEHDLSLTQLRVLSILRESPTPTTAVRYA